MRTDFSMQSIFMYTDQNTNSKALVEFQQENAFSITNMSHQVIYYATLRKLSLNLSLLINYDNVDIFDTI